MNDSKIVEMFLNRNEEAIKELSKKYEKLLKNLSFNILNNDADVLECLNDTYLKTWNSIPPHKPLYLKAYVCKIIRNLSIDKYRKNKCIKHNKEISIEELNYDVAIKDELENKLSFMTLTSDINAFLYSLDVVNQMLFIRRYFFQESIKDLSKRFSMTDSNVKVKLLRTRLKLEKYLKKRGYLIEKK